MLIGIPKEVKDEEYRVGATPDMVHALVKAGHEVVVQANAGAKIGYSDAIFEQQGAKIVAAAAEVYDTEMVVKVKEPQECEFPLMKEGQIIFGYLHLAPDPKLTEQLLKRKVVAIAYETVTCPSGRTLPLLTPMSEIAGRFAVQASANALQIASGGKGVLLGGVPGVPSAKVVIIGGGTAGKQAVRVALGLGGDVTVLDINLNRLRELDEMFGPALKTLYSTPLAIEEQVRCADLVVGAVLIPGKRAPCLVSKELIASMSPGSVIADIAIDQGGCIETAKPTTHSNPTYIVDEIVHYCVSNIPGACARSSTQALTHATLNYALKIANMGYKNAVMSDRGLLNGLNVWYGHVTNENVAVDLKYEYYDPEVILK